MMETVFQLAGSFLPPSAHNMETYDSKFISVLYPIRVEDRRKPRPLSHYTPTTIWHHVLALLWRYRILSHTTLSGCHRHGTKIGHNKDTTSIY